MESSDKNYLTVDIFLPKFCLKKLNNDSKNIEEDLNYNFKHCFCKHSDKCNICGGVKKNIANRSLDLLKIHKQVVDSGQYNYQGCRIEVNEKIDTKFMNRMLEGYNDMAVCDLLKYGFPIDLDNNFRKNLTTEIPKHFRNHNGARSFPEHMNKYLQKEASHKAIMGPFRVCPFGEGMSISPLNTVPKSSPNERRTILDLSFPKDGTGLNDYVDKDIYLGENVDLVFPKIEDFVKLIKSKGQGCLLYKLDLKRAYRQISICPSSYNMVGFMWQKHIFFDTVLSMGLRSAAYICQRVTSAFAFMMYKFGLACINYIDDFGGVESKHIAPFAFNLLRELFLRSGIEEAMEKACPPSEIMVFLGVLFNTEKMTMEVTPERLIEIRSLIESWLNKEEASLKDIQKLLGKLNFIGSCVRSSRVFVNRILNWLRECYQKDLNIFEIPEEVHKDLKWWDTFLPLYSGISLIDYGEWSLVDAVFSCDACLTGCGAVCGSSFFHCPFPNSIMEQNLSISCLEMLTVVVCLRIWCKVFSRKKIVIFCDNLATCIVINSGKAKCRFLQQCLREICFLASVHEFEVRTVHLSSESNRLADCLSRWHLSTKYQLEFFNLSSIHGITEEVLVESEYFHFLHDW